MAFTEDLLNRVPTTVTQVPRLEKQSESFEVNWMKEQIQRQPRLRLTGHHSYGDMNFMKA
jgi:hypothetical protein